MGVRIDRQNGANVLAALTEVKAVMDEIRNGPMKELGLDVQQSFDASVFIKRAVKLVTSNRLLGVLLSVGVLWWFLRDGRATLLIAISIPISLLTTFIVLQMTGRSLNVISLAGLAFAVGMVLDAAIVVSENIVRLRERGEIPDKAALEGTGQVQGALLASTATTVAIFLPVLFLQDVEGQLFADLALTIAIAVCFPAGGAHYPARRCKQLAEAKKIHPLPRFQLVKNDRISDEGQQHTAAPNNGYCHTGSRSDFPHLGVISTTGLPSPG